ncbi:MAG: tRNA preQ1(34) S-adenosylmethionine ribosyltransferase-isomerase QueA [Patescibacteria group bacterium]|nr:tRNA preQ1(34) S-adenosylmethionine ribosyltransferase-isomerase QueA [Patescibacteria group bacterium]
MQLKDFDYVLPPKLIAQQPIRPRDHSRLLVLDQKTHKIKHQYFYDLPQFLKAGDVLVFNNSKVIPARLWAQKLTGGKVEVLLLHQINNKTWEVLLGGKNLKAGMILNLNKFKQRQIELKLIKSLTQGRWQVEFNLTSQAFKVFRAKYGIAPTPPYIKRLSNLKEYQNIYAQPEGSTAAPTAGFHFTQQLIDKLKKQGVQLEFVTLHVGLDTFRPVKVNKIEDHQMHSELAVLNKKTAIKLNQAKKDGRRIIAVGTTTVRVLESAWQKNKFQSLEKLVDIFIYPGYQFKSLDGLITNFHLPKSSLLMLVSAWVGRKVILQTYQTAIQKKYRFFSFGDAMLII